MGPLLSRLQQALQGRYTVEQELGRGGMAVVFLGRDLRHDRRVAIKVYEKAGDLATGAERFLREIKVAARLQHPNILPVFDSGEGEGLVYYVMPYVAGGSVRERLEREGPLPVPDAVRIAREVAEALDHAHRAGVIHRDIKPDNIMLADGVAVVADFGIARAIEQAAGRVTETGLAIGTPTYMSPEQASASLHLDGRTDLYSLGCVLYEMLAGTPPFGGHTAQQVMARHATDTALPLGSVRPIPPALEQAVTRALAKLPADRWATGKAFAESLGSSEVAALPDRPARSSRRTSGWVAAAGLLLIGAALARWLGGGSPGQAVAPAADSIPSIAILPLELIGDTTQAHIAAGLTEALITALTSIGGVRLPGPASVSRSAAKGGDAVQTGRELHVQYVLSGRVQIAGTALRFFPRMTRVEDGAMLPMPNQDGELGDIFSMYDGLARSIVEELRLQLNPRSAAVLAKGMGTRNQDAFDRYTLGRSLYRRGDPTSVRRALEYFTQAARLDSSFAEPLIGLLDTYSLLDNVEPGRDHVSGSERRALLERALAIDSTNGDAQANRAYALDAACDTLGAEQAWQAALRLSPGSTEIKRSYAIRLLGSGRRNEAIAMIRAAAQIDPAEPWVLAVLSHAYSHAGEVDSAIVVADRALALDSTLWIANAVRGVAAGAAGDWNAAVSYLESARELGGASHGLATAYLGWAYAHAGRRREALEIARTLAERVSRGEATRWHVAAVYAGLGDREAAFQWLAKAPQVTDWKADDSLWELYFDELRTDPRFASMMGRHACVRT